MPAIDLNCDLGEDPAMLGRDMALLEVVTSANIACGGHAGDGASMEALVRACVRLGRGIGAHPGYPDRAGFGRVELEVGAAELRASIVGQVSLLMEIAGRIGARVSHVKPHGALYHAAIHRPHIAEILAEVVAELDPGLLLVSQALPPGAPDELAAACRVHGLRIVREAFADRRYEPSGLLRARAQEGALLEEPGEAAAQAVRLAQAGDAETICIHSDTPGSLRVAKAVAAAFTAAGFTLAPLASNNRA
jgi:UPF0271 protein